HGRDDDEDRQAHPERDVEHVELGLGHRAFGVEGRLGAAEIPPATAEQERQQHGGQRRDETSGGLSGSKRRTHGCGKISGLIFSTKPTKSRDARFLFKPLYRQRSRTVTSLSGWKAVRIAGGLDRIRWRRGAGWFPFP